MSTKPTITEIAKAAEVSKTTVSFVLNGKAEKYRISPDTQNRIRNLVRQLDYQPDPAARAVALGHYADFTKANAPPPAEIIPTSSTPEPEPTAPATPTPESAVVEEPVPAPADGTEAVPPEIQEVTQSPSIPEPPPVITTPAEPVLPPQTPEVMPPKNNLATQQHPLPLPEVEPTIISNPSMPDAESQPRGVT